MAYDGSVKIDSSLDTTKINKQINTLKSSMNKGFKNIAKVGAVALGAAAASVGAFAISSIKDLNTFDDKMNEVFTLLPGMSKDAMDSMKEDVKDLSTKMNVLPEEVIPAVYQALSAGVPKDNVFSFVEQATKLAKAGVAELDDSVGVLSTAVNNYKDTGLTAEQASDMLFTTVTKGVTSIPELAVALGKVIPTASSLGVSFGDVNASMATLTAKMGKGSTPEAITKMKAMLMELGDETSTVSGTFKDTAGVSFKEFTAAGGTMADAMGILTTAADKSDTSITNLFSSSEAGDAALILASNGASKLTENINAMGESSGATEIAVATMQDSTQNSIDGIMAKIEVLKLDFAQNFAPVFTDLLDAVDGLLSGTDEGMATFNSKIGEVVSQFTTQITDMLPDVIDAGVNILTNLISGLVSATPQLVNTAISLISSLTDMISTLLPDLLDSGIDILMGLIEGIVDNLPELIDTAVEIVLSLIDGLTDALPQLIEMAPDIIVALVEGLIKALPKIAVAAVKMIVALIAAVVGMYADIIQAGADLIIKFVSGIIQKMAAPVAKIKEIGTNMIDSIKNFVTDMVEVGGNIVKGLLKGITDFASKPIDAIKEVGTKMLTGIKGLFGIASPSKEMKKIGQWINEGLKEGIEDDEDVMNSWIALGAKLIASAQDWAGTIGNVINTIKGGFGNAMTGIGEAIYSGADTWSAFASAGLDALAEVLKALGAQLAAMAVVKLISWDLVGAGIATVGSAAAFIASGVLSAKAASYDVGGIIGEDQLARIHKDETIIPAGFMSDIKSSGLTIAPMTSRGGSNISQFNATMVVNGRTIAREVFKYTDENAGLAYQG